MNSELADTSLSFFMQSVAGAMEDYEIRPSQTGMMAVCAEAVERGGTFMAEAGTGTGKTFAYLIPLILSGTKAIVSTRTINLQEQIASKDLKFLSGLMDFNYAIAKGRSNYLCLRRLNAFRAVDDNDGEEYSMLLRWVSGTATGDVEDYVSGRTFIWERVCSDADACKGVKCNYYRQCFYFSARRRWEDAQIIVANHALVGINALLDEGSKILPSAEVLVIDEAHALDNVLSDVSGITLSNKGFERIINRFLRMDEKGIHKGILSRSPHLFPFTEALKAEMGLFWMSVKKHMEHRQAIRGPFTLNDQLLGLSGSVDSLVEKIRTSAGGLFLEDEELELKADLIKLRAYASGMKEFCEGAGDVVRWPEIESRRTALRMSPVYPRDFVLERLAPDYRTMILTSATLSVSGDFGFIKKVLGLEDSQTISVPSPFDLSRQVVVDIRRGIDHRGADNAEKLADVITEAASLKEGGVLALFTSRDTMNRTWELSIERLSSMGLNPMVQGEIPNRTMLEIMRDSRNSVIFGLDSFWEGVDVKGDSLKCLIITKLPFEVPTDPIVQARTEEIERGGGNPFYEYSLPRAVLKFRQGFGRLIRSRVDTGRVVICDERIETKSYGQYFKKSF